MATLKENLQEIKNQKDTYLLPENFKNGVTCLGVTETFTSDATALASDIVEGKIAYVNGQKITGNVIEQLSDEEIPIYDGDNDREITIVYNAGDGTPENPEAFATTVLFTGEDENVLIRPNNTIGLIFPASKVATAMNLTADKIVQGEKVLGVEGTGSVVGINLYISQEKPTDTFDGIYIQVDDLGMESGLNKYNQVLFYQGNVESDPLDTSSIENGTIIIEQDPNEAEIVYSTKLFTTSPTSKAECRFTNVYFKMNNGNIGGGVHAYGTGTKWESFKNDEK